MRKGSRISIKSWQSMRSDSIRTSSDGYRALICALLVSALVDSRKDGLRKDRALFFVGSSFCEQLCDAVDVDVDRYRKEIRRKR